MGRRAIQVGAAIALASAPGAQAAERDFEQRFARTLNGDLTIAGNVLHTCDPADTAGPGGTCLDARSGAAPGFFNNDHAMIQADADADASTFNSSSAGVTLPPGAQVRFAGLYWAAATLGTGGGASPDVAARGTVRLDTPASLGYVGVAAAKLDDLGSGGNGDYAAFADVTALVAAGGAGTYTVADVQSAPGKDTYAGWALVVAFDAPGQTLRNVSVFDGYQFMFDGPGGHATVTNTISGFRTPAVGPVTTRAGIVGYEGEVTPAAATEGVTIDGTPLDGGALNPSTDFFNGSITRLGARVTDKTPDQVLQISSLDADLIEGSGILAPGATSAQLQLAANANDGWYAQVLTFATEVQQPLVTLAKTVTDVGGAPTRAGDVVEYAITATNTGNDTADAVVVTDPLPGATSLVPGSIAVAGVPVTDAADADPGELAGGAVVARLGSVAAGATRTVGFRATIAPGTATGSAVANVAGASYAIPASAVTLSATSNTVSSSVAAPPPADDPPATTTTTTTDPPPTTTGAAPPPAPVAPPATTPAGGPPPVTSAGTAPSFASVVRLPSVRRCVSRRNFRIRLVAPKDDPIRRAQVFVNGRRVRTIRADRVRAPVDLRGLPKGRFSVRIVVTTRSGRTIKGTRRYRTCVPKRRRG